MTEYDVLQIAIDSAPGETAMFERIAEGWELLAVWKDKYGNHAVFRRETAHERLAQEK